MRVSAALPQGVHALFFESARRRRALESALAARLEAAGFAEVLLPILDYFEPYEPLLGTAGRAELYRFIGRDGELLCLRADFTPLLARLLAPRLGSLPLPQRLYYRGDVVRFEEERAGRQREFYQLGAELLGVAGEAGEAEMLRRFVELLTMAGGAVAEIQVVLGFAGALDGLLLAGGEPAALAAAVARRERSAVRQLAACSEGSGAALRAVAEHGLPERPEDLGPTAAARLAGLLVLRDELAAAFPSVRLVIDLAEFALCSLDPSLAPDLAAGEAGQRQYYDGLVFRAFVGGSALPVGGGGRYDRLFHELGAEVPAVGFSLSLDRLLPFTVEERP